MKSGSPICINKDIYDVARPGRILFNQVLKVPVQPTNNLLPAFNRNLCMGCEYHGKVSALDLPAPK